MLAKHSQTQTGSNHGAKETRIAGPKWGKVWLKTRRSVLFNKTLVVKTCVYNQNTMPFLLARSNSTCHCLCYRNIGRMGEILSLGPISLIIRQKAPRTELKRDSRLFEANRESKRGPGWTNIWLRYLSGSTTQPSMLTWVGRIDIRLRPVSFTCKHTHCLISSPGRYSSSTSWRPSTRYPLVLFNFDIRAVICLRWPSSSFKSYQAPLCNGTLRKAFHFHNSAFWILLWSAE